MMAKTGQRAKYIGPDKVFHEGQRLGKTGTIVLDAELERGSNFGGETCGWQADGDEGVYVTGLAELELLS